MKENTPILHLSDYADDLILIGAYREDKAQLAWIHDKKLYNIRHNVDLLESREGGVLAPKLPKFIIIYSWERPTEYEVYASIRVSEKKEATMKKMGYPDPQGAYFLYDLGAQYDLPSLDLAAFLIAYKQSHQDFVDAAPFYIQGKELIPHMAEDMFIEIPSAKIINATIQRIDILEEEILKLDHQVLERLLWDHSREQYIGDDGEKHHHHIYWATDMYEKEGKGFGFFDEIEIASVTGDYRTLVRPRAAKSKEERELRTRVKAEVFTPAWICNAQVNLIDNAWFGREDVFNHENNDHTWIPNREKITFPKGKTWQDYVWDKRLEITCGEAPYLVSRYDAVTAEAIDDLYMRIGILDRKLRVVSENVSTSKEWIFWGKCALKSTYGFEWQGDNILLAREALFYTFCDYYEAFCRDVLGQEGKLSIATLRTIAYIISWNIWQMDGLNYTLPMSGSQSEIARKQQAPSLFSVDEQPHEEQKISDIQREKIYAMIADWQKNGELNRKPERFDASIPKPAKK